MRRYVLALLPLVFAGAISGPALAADCSGDVKAAFMKQRAAKMYRVSLSQPTAEGNVDMTVDYILPDRMLQTVVAPHMPGEQQTMLVGERAFSGSAGGYEELLPQFSHSVIAEFVSATQDELKLGNFECVGKTTFEGTEYLGYRAAEEKKEGRSLEETLARTIYIDEKTGLPAFNVVQALAGSADPVFKAHYTYPTDLEIEAPIGAPIQKRVQ